MAATPVIREREIMIGSFRSVDATALEPRAHLEKSPCTIGPIDHLHGFGARENRKPSHRLASHELARCHQSVRSIGALLGKPAFSNSSTSAGGKLAGPMFNDGTDKHAQSVFSCHAELDEGGGAAARTGIALRC